MRFLIAALLVAGYSLQSAGAVQTRVIEYKHGDTVLEGYMAWDDGVQGRRPGVLVVHDWTGLGDYARTRSKQLAEMGYVAFALDMYGQGVRPKTPLEAAAQAGIYKKDRSLMRSRAQAGLKVLLGSRMCDATRVAAIGYCFGGTTVLELARSGADIAGVVSFHGGLDTPKPGDAKNIRCKLLVLHGGDDPLVPSKDVEAFEDEMRAGGADWQLVVYGGAVHSFTNPAAGDDKSKGAAYDAKAADVRPVADQPGYAYAAVYQFDKHGKLVVFHDFVQLRGTQDWQRRSYTFSVHPQADRVSIRCGLHQAQGTAWFDNWTLVAGAEAKSFAEVDERSSRGARLQDTAAILCEPELPAAGAPAKPETIAAILREAGFETTLVSAQSLADQAVLNRSRFDLVVIPTGPVFPATARSTLTDFLRDGGDLITLGGYAFDRLVRKVEGCWTDEESFLAAEIDKRMTPGGGLLPDGGFEQDESPSAHRALDGRWRRDAAHTSLVAEQPHEGQRCAKAAVPHGSTVQGAQFYTDVPAQPGAEYRITAWMRSQDVVGPGYAFMAVYQYDAEGKMVAFRDFGTARGTTPWRQHAYTFTAQADAARLHVMLGLYNAQGTAWFDDFRLAEITGLAFEPMNTARGRPEDGLVVSPAQLGMFDASFPLKRVRGLQSASGQHVVDFAVDVPCSATGWAASGVTGMDDARWIPLLEAYDTYRRPRGAAVAMLLHYRGFYSGSCWLYCGVDNQDLFGDPQSELARTLQNAARFMIRKTFLRNLTTDHRLYRTGEPVQAKVTVDNRGPRPQTVEVRFAWDEQPPMIRTVHMTPGQSREVSAEFGVPAGSSGLHRVRTVAWAASKPIDELVTGVVVDDTKAAPRGLDLRFEKNYFTLNGRPQFLFGSDDYAVTYRAAAENPWSWSQMLVAARDHGLNLYENLQYRGPGYKLRDEDWRDFSALNQLVQQNQLVFMPGMLIGEDAAAGPDDLARQSALCRQYAVHFCDTPGVLYYINGDYSLLRDPASPEVQRMWNEWLQQRYETPDKLRAAWPGVAVPEATGPGQWVDLSFPPPNSGRWDDPAAIDAMAFRHWLIQRWNAAHVDAVRQVDTRHPITSEYYQRPFGGIDLRLTIDGQDVSNVGFFAPPKEDLDTLPIVLRWNDLRARGKGVGLGEYGVKTHPAWQEKAGGSGYHIARTEEERRQLFLSVACYALGMGASRIQNWCLRDDSTRVFPWGLFYPNGFVPKDVAYAHRNLSLAWRRFMPVDEPPTVTVCLASALRTGNADALGLTIGSRTFADLLALHYEFNTIDDENLAELPAATRVLILPSPLAISDRGFAELQKWVAGGGTLLVTGDFSYDTRRQRTRTGRLEQLAGVRFVEESYPNVARAQGADVQADLAGLGLGKAVLRPCIRIQPTTAGVLGRTADGQPVLVRNRAGQGAVYYLTDPLELAEDEPSNTLRRDLYAAVLRAGRVVPLPIEPNEPWLHVMQQPIRQGTVHVVFNTRTEPGGAEVQLATAAGRLTLATRNRWPALAAVSHDGRVLTLLTDGVARLDGQPLLEGLGLKLVSSLDGADLRQSEACLVAPFEPGTCLLPLRPGEFAATWGEFHEGAWKTYSQQTLAAGSAELNLDQDGATCLILVTKPERLQDWAEQLWTAGRMTE